MSINFVNSTTPASAKKMNPSTRRFLAREAKAIRRLKARATKRLFDDVIEMGRRLDG